MGASFSRFPSRGSRHQREQGLQSTHSSQSSDYEWDQGEAPPLKQRKIGTLGRLFRRRTQKPTTLPARYHKLDEECISPARTSTNLTVLDGWQPPAVFRRCTYSTEFDISDVPVAEKEDR